MQLFAQAAPPGSRLLRVTGAARTPGLSVWSTRAANGTVRAVLINKSRSANRTVALRPPPGMAATATIERLRGPSVHARRGITLGGASYGASTTTGRLPAMSDTAIARRGRSFGIAVPRASAALVTLTPR